MSNKENNEDAAVSDEVDELSVAVASEQITPQQLLASQYNSSSAKPTPYANVCAHDGRYGRQAARTESY